MDIHGRSEATDRNGQRNPAPVQYSEVCAFLPHYTRGKRRVLTPTLGITRRERGERSGACTNYALVRSTAGRWRARFALSESRSQMPPHTLGDRDAAMHMIRHHVAFNAAACLRTCKR